MAILKSTKAVVFELPVSKLVTMRDIQSMTDFIQQFHSKYTRKKSLNNIKKRNRVKFTLS
jgi:hypothetical protein